MKTNRVRIRLAALVTLAVLLSAPALPAWTAMAAPLASGSPYALDFDGPDDHVLIAAAPSLNFDTGLAFSPAALAAGEQILYATGELSLGEKDNPSLSASGQRAVNLKLQVPAVTGSGTITLRFTDGSGGSTFTGTILDGETLWAVVTVKPGDNVFELENTSGVGGPVLQYELWVYEVAEAPFNWSGISQAAGTWRSSLRLNFPSSGLYQFDFSHTAGQYQFLVDNDYVQKTVAGAGNVRYYISAGAHTLNIQPDTHWTEISWSLNISAPGAVADSLPYEKTGVRLGGAANDFAEEWLPLYLASATLANFELTLAGNSTDTADVRLYRAVGITPFQSIQNVYGGETRQWTAYLAAGLTRVQLVADAGNVDALGYELQMDLAYCSYLPLVVRNNP